jgi:5-methyltetrahydropteroyltriglutamate--homocysteine methyltransferase
MVVYSQVPEVSDTVQPKLEAQALLNKVKRAQQALGTGTAVPMIIGPVTMARLSSLSKIDVPGLVSKLVPLYQDLLKQLKALSV